MKPAIAAQKAVDHIRDLLAQCEGPEIETLSEFYNAIADELEGIDMRIKELEEEDEA
ncbi:MAG: hypothetical protein ACOX9C_06510 [Kiritimatiellia bacterium]|jgi:hypothetical protein